MKQAHELSDAELAEALRQCEAVKIQERALRAEAMRRAEKNPACLPGWALRDMRATRKWDNPEGVRQTLDGLGLHDYVVATPLSPAQLEKQAKLDPDLAVHWPELKERIVAQSSGKTLVQVEQTDDPFADGP